MPRTKRSKRCAGRRSVPARWNVCAGCRSAAARNQDLTEEAAIEIAERVSHELIDDLAARGEIRFDRDGR